MRKGQSIRKWQKKLTKSELNHIRNTTSSGTLNQFWFNRKWHKENGVRCIECETIEKKLKGDE